MIKITYKLILLLSLLAMTVTSFAASEAKYRKLGPCMPTAAKNIDPPWS